MVPDVEDTPLPDRVATGVGVAKKLALFLDGTWNSIDSSTNVRRLFESVLPTGRDGAAQKSYYDIGVGAAAGEKWRGTLGYGLSTNVLEAYAWLVEQYEENDEIYIFGFSRGAYTARSVAGVIATCGLLRRGAPLSVEDVYERYRQGDAVRPIWKIDYAKSQGQAVTPEEERMLANARRVPVKMIGVWDTVGALGIPFGNSPISAQRFRFHNADLSKLYEHAYHAMAIDENRKAFKPTLWTRFRKAAPDPGGRPATAAGQKVEQRWFVGAHSNVGGGIAGSDMSQRPLAWMRGKAERAGLAFSPLSLTGHEHEGPIADSFGEFMFGVYSLFGLRSRFHRTIAAPTREVKGGLSDTINETVDGSVFERWRSDPAYRPPGLVEWSARTGIDPGTAVGAIDARTGAPVEGAVQ
jgi:uncharacterized protein (DUF2235 family)